jgi:hypothetical protein
MPADRDIPPDSRPPTDTEAGAARAVAADAVTEHHDDQTAREAIELDLEDAELSEAGTEVDTDDHPA